MGAKAAGVSGKKLEEKVSTLLVKGWRKGMQVDGTIKHVYISYSGFMIFFVRIALVTEPSELFEMMVKIMRATCAEGESFYLYLYSECTTD